MSVADAGEVWERAKSLQEKMQANLQMAKDRLDVLGIIFLKYKTGVLTSIVI